MFTQWAIHGNIQEAEGFIENAKCCLEYLPEAKPILEYQKILTKK